MLKCLVMCRVQMDLPDVLRPKLDKKKHKKSVFEMT